MAAVLEGHGANGVTFAVPEAGPGVGGDVQSFAVQESEDALSHPTAVWAVFRGELVRMLPEELELAVAGGIGRPATENDFAEADADTQGVRVRLREHARQLGRALLLSSACPGPPAGAGF